MPYVDSNHIQDIFKKICPERMLYYTFSRYLNVSTQSYILLICREYLFQLQQKLFSKFILIYLYLHPIENTISLQDDPKCTHYFT